MRACVRACVCVCVCVCARARQYGAGCTANCGISCMVLSNTLQLRVCACSGHSDYPALDSRLNFHPARFS
jgi:hypothetical protein